MAIIDMPAQADHSGEKAGIGPDLNGAALDYWNSLTIDERWSAVSAIARQEKGLPVSPEELVIAAAFRAVKDTQDTKATGSPERPDFAT